MCRKIKIIISSIVLLIINFCFAYSYETIYDLPENRIFYHNDPIFIYPGCNVDSLINQITPKSYAIVDFYGMDSVDIDHALNKIKNKIDYGKLIGLSFDKCNFVNMPILNDMLEGILMLRYCNFNHDIELPIIDSFRSNLSLIFKNCSFTKLPKKIEKINKKLNLRIDDTSSLKYNINEQLKRFIAKNNINCLLIDVNKLDYFPNSIFDLTSLQALHISSYRLKEIPDEFKKLKNLQTIHLPVSFADYPKSIFKLGEEQQLRISGNDFSKFFKMKE